MIVDHEEYVVTEDFTQVGKDLMDFGDVSDFIKSVIHGTEESHNDEDDNKTKLNESQAELTVKTNIDLIKCQRERKIRSKFLHSKKIKSPDRGPKSKLFHARFVLS